MKKITKNLKKLRIYPSFLLLILVCIILGKFRILVNYLLALTFHEFSHFLVSEAKGYRLKEFRLDLFGASMELDSSIDDKDSFWINLAGPLGNIIMCVLCLAMYSILPYSKYILSDFCMCNLVIASFNLLPIYPLDGYKVFASFFKLDRHKKLFSIIAKIVVVLLSLSVFVITLVGGQFSIIPIIIIVFALTTKSETKLELAIFKNKSIKAVQSVEIIRVNKDMTIIGALKRIKKNHYTIFYVDNSHKFYDEDYLVELALRYTPNTKLSEIA